MWGTLASAPVEDSKPVNPRPKSGSDESLAEML